MILVFELTRTADEGGESACHAIYSHALMLARALIMQALYLTPTRAKSPVSFPPSISYLCFRWLTVGRISWGSFLPWGIGELMTNVALVMALISRVDDESGGRWWCAH